MLTRREMLHGASCGFGYLALAALAAERARAAGDNSSAAANPLAPHAPHFVPKAKRVIFLFMQGGVSHVDSFDFKPTLIEQDGKSLSFNDLRAQANRGVRETPQRVMKPRWTFDQYGECGHWASDLFPEMNKEIDRLCFVHSLHTEGIAHGPATLFLHCGSTNFIRPSMGSWITYGLGSENENLPGFVSIAPSAGNGGPRNYGPAFLPAVYQGTALGKAGAPARDATIRNLSNASLGRAAQRQQLDFLQQLNAEQSGRRPGDSELEAVINSYELGWRMQQNAPEVLDLSRESAETLAMYGIGEKETDNYGRQCLLARRLCEAGVRYIQVTYGDSSANPAWDQHSNLEKHGVHAKATDKPVAGLLADLAQRGLLDDTLVWWGSEFGRTPYAEKNGTGRDHNPSGFTTWLAGAGVKPGFAHGATDEFGKAAVENKVHMHDLHATILHLLGLDHLKLTFKYAGRNFRLTDVAGEVVHDIIA